MSRKGSAEVSRKGSADVTGPAKSLLSAAAGFPHVLWMNVLDVIILTHCALNRKSVMEANVMPYNKSHTNLN